MLSHQSFLVFFLLAAMIAVGIALITIIQQSDERSVHQPGEDFESRVERLFAYRFLIFIKDN